MTFQLSWLTWLISLVSVISLSFAHSVNNRPLVRAEPLRTVALDIAPRPETFFTKRSVSRNPSYEPRKPKAIEHDDILRLAMSAYNRTFFLHLHPNVDLFHPNAVFTFDGKQVPLRPEEFRVYRGYVIHEFHTDQRWLADQAGVWRDDLAAEEEEGVLGWARIVIRNDIRHDLEYPVFEGAFQAEGDLYHVKAVHNYKLSKRSDDVEIQDHPDTHMIIYRDSDTTLERRDTEPGTGDPECGFDRLLFNGAGNRPHSRKINIRIGHPAAREWGVYMPENKLQLGILGEPDAHIVNGLRKRAPAGCPTTKKINYMGAAADCTYTRQYQSPDNARTQIINDWNTASAVYERTFNVQLGLINITIMPESCPSTPPSNAPWNRDCSTSYPIETRLSDFSRWRGSIGNDGAGLWHLMTSCATGIEVGIAWLNQLCTIDATAQRENGQMQYVSGTGVSSVLRDEWKVVAHEIGHNFGAIHDCTADTCPCSGSSCNCCPLSSTTCDAGGTYIMNPSSNVSTNDFSPCTIEKVCSAFPSLGTCLQDPGSRTIKTLQMCGNGIKEDGEDCDPGGQDSNCCDAATCKFKNNAKCDDATDLCCQNCQLRPSSYVCRPATSACDIEEKCTGTSGDCPADQHQQDGTSCGNGLQCASGQCTSRDLQCKQRGTTMNITRSCSSASGSCQLICDNPGGFGCIMFNGYFVDGTPCGIGGTCKSGSCSLDNFGNNAKNWIENHKEIAIPVIVVFGLLVLFCIARCIFYGCCGYSGYRTVNGNKGVYVVSSAPPAYSGPYYPQPQGGMAPGHWVDPAAYNGAPSAPPPTYTPGAGQVREAYEMNPADSWRAPTTPSPAPARPDSDISGRVRRFEGRMSPR